MMLQKTSLMRPRAWQTTVICACVSTLPTVAAAQTQDSGGSALIAVLALGLLLVSALAIYFFLAMRRQQNEIKEHSEILEHVSDERDDALNRLSAKTREIDETLNTRIHELEDKNEELSEATAKLRKLVVVDELTQLSNRLHFDQVMPH